MPPEPEARRFDFATNAWVRDDFLSRRAVELPAPAAPPREGRWVAPLEPVRSPRTALVLGLAGAVLGAGGALGGREGLALAGLAVVYGLVSLHNLPAPKPREVPEDRCLLEDANDPDVCLVDAAIVFDGLPVGTDRGAAWFADGALLFSGRRTSFAVGGEDVLPRSYWSEYGRERASALPDDAIPLRTTRPRTYVRLVPVAREGQAAPKQAREFLRSRAEFRDRPTSSSGVLRQWPPFRQS